jgi:hypothetical protein
MSRPDREIEMNVTVACCWFAGNERSREKDKQAGNVKRAQHGPLQSLGTGTRFVK